jgi:hypothetical protein
MVVEHNNYLKFLNRFVVMGNKSKQQHTVPRTYLKHWRISEQESFVYVIDFSVKGKPAIKQVGLNDKVFKRDRYYNDNTLSDPYILETIFSENFEPIYESIMNEIKQESILSQQAREKLVRWLYISIMRSPVLRNNHKRLISFEMKVREEWGGKVLTEDREREIEKEASERAKKLHLGAFFDKEHAEELVKLFVGTLLAKHWRILKSTPAYEFWTNDNPGFSPNITKRFGHEPDYHYWFELNSNGIMYFPLSPKYCLEITPFQMGTPAEISAATMDIKFETVALEYVDLINEGVFYTRDRLVISSNKRALEISIGLR